jgi:hypothetical protein
MGKDKRKFSLQCESCGSKTPSETSLEKVISNLSKIGWKKIDNKYYCNKKKCLK